MRTFYALALTLLFSLQVFAHQTYTGYSGAPNRSTCASSCHGSPGGTITLTGFPATYTPGQAYTLTVGHTAGVAIANFNASVRVGTGTVNAGTIAAGTNTAVYNVTGETNGVHFSPAQQNSGTFTWTAPAAGTGAVTLYLGGLQGTVSDPAEDTEFSLSAAEATVALPGAATAPSPANLATAIALTPTLSWTAGTGAASHDVYFGTANPPALIGNQAGTSYAPAALTAGTVYYWRVDERNAAGVTAGTVWQFTTLALPAVAASPTPANLATNVALSPTLSWVAGLRATSHDVRFGTTNPPALIANQAGTTYAPAPLTAGTIYYWRIDERNASGVTTGTVWQFTTGSLPGLASAPAPANLATGIALTPTLSWTAGTGAASHDVYFGTANPPALIGNQAGLTYAPPALTAGTIYYWRITERNAIGTTSGTVWQFTTAPALPVPGVASAPSPANLATGIALTPTLSWTAGSNAASHDVYFGTSNPPASIGNQAGTSYAPAALIAGTIYYWRVDERNASGVTAGTVWQFTTLALPGVASAPAPANLATGIALTPTLSWTAGSNAASHDVYFGTSNPPASIGNQAGTTYAPAALTAGTVYYWRVNERNASGVTTGTVWQFTTLAFPGVASGPSPANVATGVALTPTLSWTAGSNAASHDVYFGTSNPPASIGNQAGTTYAPAALTAGTVYYWRVDERNASGVTAGTVWQFTTLALPGVASAPTPANLATGIALNPTLSWTAGSNAASHDVYFGTANPPASIGNQAGTTYAPSALTAGTVYYWRVDERNASGVTAGTVWQFTTAAALPVPGVATAPAPTNLATGVALTPNLSWSAGSNAASHDVFFGTSNPPASIGNQAGTTYAPAALTAGTVYYWRVDERNASGVTAGTLWQFTTLALPGVASGPSPANVATGVALTPTLSWTAGSNAASHDVFFGTSNPPVSIGNQAGTSYAPSALTSGTVYYWRVNERNASGVTTGPVWQFTTVIVLPVPGVASAPSPANLATGIALTPTLSWTAGSNAASHDVYFGTANPPASIGNQAGTSYAPSTLTAGTIYYWRVDERNASGVTAGTVWQFTTAAALPLPGVASSPSPADLASSVSLTPTLSWTAGSNAASHDVYFGTANPPASIGNQAGTSYTPTALTAGTVYYWRVDERNASGVTAGAVWQFTTAAALPLPGVASSPSPADLASSVSLTPTLSWTAGSNAASHDVYFGTANPPASIGNQAGTSYAPTALTAGTVYYWRVDERNASGVTAGTVWQFTTQTVTDLGGVSNPIPADGATRVSTGASLSWQGHTGSRYNVYLGTSANLTRVSRLQFRSSYRPEHNFRSGTTYYWRVDEVTTTGTVTGTVWSFRTQRSGDDGGDDGHDGDHNGGERASDSPEFGDLFPNPFNAVLTVPFTLPQAANVKLVLYDILGRQVAVLANGGFEAGAHSVQWSCVGVGSGTYLLSLTANNRTITTRITAIK
jgi:hypothetical protein